MCNYWLIPMDFTKCNYEQLKVEWQQNKKIMWQAPGKPKYKNGKWIVANNMGNFLKKGDVVYFYVTNLPSESSENLSRIMLRGIIKDEPSAMEKNKIYISSKDPTMVTGFSISCLTTLKKEYLEDNTILNREHLQKQDINFINPQGKNWPDRNIKGNFSDKIIKLLEQEQYFKENIQNNDFQSLINHFNKKCFFYDKYGNKNDHKTFIARNGLDYFEYHHFIPQYTAKKNNKLVNIIRSSSNGLFLCSNCHNRIHYGTKEAVINMLEKALEDDKINKMLKDYEFQKYIGDEKNILEWFKEMYKVTEND